MDNLCLQTKIEISSDIWRTYNYLNLNYGSFLIYTRKDINIKFIKNINNEKLMCLNNNKLYIFII